MILVHDQQNPLTTYCMHQNRHTTFRQRDRDRQTEKRKREAERETVRDTVIGTVRQKDIQ